MPGMIVATYNSQGAKWSEVRHLLTKCDAVAVQECGAQPKKAVPLRSIYKDEECEVGFYRWDTFLLLHCAWGVNKRCSMAIVNRRIPDNLPRYFGIGAEKATRRPLIGFELWPRMWLFCMHVVSLEGEAAESATGMINFLAARIPMWVCLADYNCDPHQLVVFKPKCVIVPPERPTHTSGRCLDYATHSKGVDCLALEVSGKNGGSDHFPSLFGIEFDD